jgi:hypothetical protein
VNCHHLEKTRARPSSRQADCETKRQVQDSGVADIKLMLRTYRFVTRGTTPKKHKSGADPSDQCRSLVRNFELTSLSNYGQVSPAGGV